MQDIIIKEIVEYSTIDKDVAKELIAALIKVNLLIPEEIKSLRPSLKAFNNIIIWGGNIEDAHASSILAMNAKHACFGDAYDTIKYYVENRSLISRIIPGFGNPIFKEFDERCDFVRSELKRVFPIGLEILEKVEQEIYQFINNATVKSNIVFWNAGVIYLLGLPKDYASLPFIIATQIAYIKQIKRE